MIVIHTNTALKCNCAKAKLFTTAQQPTCCHCTTSFLRLCLYHSAVNAVHDMPSYLLCSFEASEEHAWWLRLGLAQPSAGPSTCIITDLHQAAPLPRAGVSWLTCAWHSSWRYRTGYTEQQHRFQKLAQHGNSSRSGRAHRGCTTRCLNMTSAKSRTCKEVVSTSAFSLTV